MPNSYSIVIAAHNNWIPLEGCLKSIAEQVNPPRFEVIVVDDGSDQPAPGFIRNWASVYSLTILRQAHAGAAAARNRGVEASRGSVLVFVDADCRMLVGCLTALESEIRNSPQDHCFQLRLVGDCSCLAGRAEDLRLRALQDQLLLDNGNIRYLNTAGFAMRLQSPNVKEIIFDPSVRRGEDTLLLASLMQKGKMPRFVSGAAVQHIVSLPLARYLLKDMRSGWHEWQADRKIAAKGIRIRMNHRERLRMMWRMWAVAADPSLGRTAYFALLARQLLERCASHGFGRLGRAANDSGYTKPFCEAAN